jgi:hypothetical protein
METFVKSVGAVVVLILAVVVIGMIMAWPVMILWNLCLVPAVQGLQVIGWLQAWGILVVCGILFKSTNISNK